MKCYEKAKSILIDGGITPKNLQKNLIEPEKKALSKSRLKKWVKRAEPPKFKAHPTYFQDSKMNEAIMEKYNKEKKILDECTFYPNVSHQMSEIRDADEFYRDQQIYELR